jgi:DNA-binding XRE family transcriptional regulator
MATLTKPKITRVKRDYEPFRNRLRDVILDLDITQTKAAKIVGMDARTFNHVVAGPTHPDLQLLRDIGEKFNVNLNYLFGLSKRKEVVPNDIDLTDMITLPYYEHSEGAEWQPEYCETNKTFKRFEVVHKFNIEGRTNPWGHYIKSTQCDALQGVNAYAFLEVVSGFTKKGIYNIGVNGKSYMRWIDRPLGNSKLRVSTDVLQQDCVELEEEQVLFAGIVYRKGADF